VLGEIFPRRTKNMQRPAWLDRKTCNAQAVRQALRERVDASVAALGQAFSNPDLRRLQLAGAGSIIGSWSYIVALAVYAFEQGGATAVGLVALIRYIPSALASPLTSALGDRYPRKRVMIGADLIRLGAMAAAATTIAVGGSPIIVYLLAAVTTVTSTAFRPAQAALLPSLARTPDELTAANVAASTIESVGIFVGPALGALLLDATGPEVVFAVNGASFLWSALLVASIKPEEAIGEPGPVAQERHRPVNPLAGFSAIARESKLRIVVLLTAAQTLVFGALTVLIVVLAFDLLETGSAGVGLLNSAIGVGGLVGSLVAASLVGRPRLGASFGIGIALWGLPLAIVALWLNPLFALALFAVIGAANTVVDVSGLTLIQRTAADRVRARVFGVLEGLMVATIGLGALLAPLLISLLGSREALVITGSALPLLTVLTWRSLSRLDAVAPPPGRELELLRSIPMFAPLPPATLEELASSLEPVRVAAGAEVFRQGDPGDRFYVIGDGEVEVQVDGQPQTVLGQGEYFGEIALLRDVPRTATVSARRDSLLYALERDEFISAVTGHPTSVEAADAVIGARLGAGVIRAGTA
jgi:predicted MFS family arabinose efflux permease